MSTLAPATNKPSQIETLVRAITNRGLRIKPAMPGSLPLFGGLAMAGFGLMLLASLLLPRIDPYYYFVVPRCPGNPQANLIAATCLTIFGLAAIMIGRLRHDDIVVTDEKLIVTYRSGRHAHYAWHNMEAVYNVFNSYKVLQLKSGKFRLIPAAPLNTSWRLDLTLLLPLLLNPYLDTANPKLSVAFNRLKTDLLGKGVSFPMGDPTQFENRQRIIVVGGLAVVLTAVLAFFGWTGTMGPAFGLFAIAFAIATSLLIRRGPRLLDHAVVTRSALSITRAGVPLATIQLENIKSLRMIGDFVAVNCYDKAQSTGIALDDRSARLLVEVVKIAKNLPGLRLVDSNKSASAA